MLSAHSMEEAEALCDRLGIFVDGRLQCVGNPKEVHCSSDMLYQNIFQNETIK
jgi:ABC-type multidrug transport system ATPase subunit